MLQQRRRVCLDCKASLATQRRTRETRILKPEMRSLQKVVSVGKGDVSKTWSEFWWILLKTTCCVISEPREANNQESLCESGIDWSAKKNHIPLLTMWWQYCTCRCIFDPEDFFSSILTSGCCSPDIKESTQKAVKMNVYSFLDSHVLHAHLVFQEEYVLWRRTRLLEQFFPERKQKKWRSQENDGKKIASWISSVIFLGFLWVFLDCLTFLPCLSLQTFLVDLSLLNCSRRNRSVLFPVYPDDCVAKRWRRYEKNYSSQLNIIDSWINLIA